MKHIFFNHRERVHQPDRIYLSEYRGVFAAKPQRGAKHCPSSKKTSSSSSCVERGSIPVCSKSSELPPLQCGTRQMRNLSMHLKSRSGPGGEKKKQNTNDINVTPVCGILGALELHLRGQSRLRIFWYTDFSTLLAPLVSVSDQLRAISVHYYKNPGVLRSSFHCTMLAVFCHLNSGQIRDSLLSFYINWCTIFLENDKPFS